MTRHLTPSKIGLLALASLYMEGVVPLSQTTSILSFLLSHILPDASHAFSPQSSGPSITTGISVFETALSAHDSALPGRTVWDLLLQRLWSINSADALDTFLTSTPTLLARSREQILRDREYGEKSSEHHGRIRRSSPLGNFIRRTHMEYTRLQFDGANWLWQKFLSWRLPTRQAFEKKNPADALSVLEINLFGLQIDSSHPIAQIAYGRLADGEDEETTSTSDVERLLQFQVSKLQRLGGRLPDDMTEKLRQLSSSGVRMPSTAHYLRFLDSWRAGDHASAFDNLHRYFDYSMQSRDRTFYQYALLNLAILQADFGCHGEAVPAMQEAISAARETNDVACLNFCMSWLYQFGAAFPSEMQEIRESGILGSETEGLAFLKSRAKDTEMWSLLSTTLLSEATLGLHNGESAATAFENIAKAAHLGVTKDITNIDGSILLTRSSLYSRIGLGHLAWQCGQTFLDCYAADAPAEDILRCTCWMAHLLAQKGRYEQATQLMEEIPEHVLRVLKYTQYWTYFNGMLKMRRHLHRSDFEEASYMLSNLKGQGAPDTEVGFALSLLEVDLLVRREAHDKALDRVAELATTAHPENTNVFTQIKLLNVKAHVLAKCGHPLKGFSLVVRAADMANQARILPGMWEAAGILSTILVELHEFQAAVDVLEAIVSQVFECEDCYLTARTFSALVDAHMGLAGQEAPESVKREEHISKVMEYIDSALEQFKHVEDLRGQCDMLAKKATVLDFRGDMVLAKDVAYKYLGLKKEYNAVRVLS